MREAISRINWQGVISGVLSALITMFLAGMWVQARESRIGAIEQKIEGLTQRQTRLEALVVDRLDRIGSTLTDLRMDLARERAQQELFHRGQLAR